MFLRFVGAQLDERTGQPVGALTLAYELLRSSDLSGPEADELREHVNWLQTELPVPNRFARKRNVSHKETHGLSWVRAEVADVVARLRSISEILGRHGHAIHVLRETRPGYIVYEDKWQVVAEPFHGERR